MMKIQDALEVLRKRGLYVEERKNRDSILGMDTPHQPDFLGNINLAGMKSIFQIEKINEIWIGSFFLGQTNLIVGTSTNLEKVVKAIINIFEIAKNLESGIDGLLNRLFDLQEDNLLMELETVGEITVYPCLKDQIYGTSRQERMINKSRFIDSRYMFTLMQSDSGWTIRLMEAGRSDKNITAESLENSISYIINYIK